MPNTSYQPAAVTVMLLAAGRGKRMQPLTDHTPKPLLKVAGASLIEHHLRRLADQGFKRVIINHAHLGEQIVARLGDGSNLGLNIYYSDESTSGALETAGGIVKALPLINTDPFLVINGDIFTDFKFVDLLRRLHTNARLVMVPNPKQHPNGDFCIDSRQRLRVKSKDCDSSTFSGIALYKQAFFAGLETGRLALGPMLHVAATNRSIEAVSYSGEWHDVGTPQRLEKLNERYATR